VTVDAASVLLARHEQLPARAGAAAKVLLLADDPDTSAQQLARAIATDPVFAARVLRVANSSYYGLSGRVSTLPFAVSVVGFQTVRGLAVVAAAGLDDPNAAPDGFWAAAATCATAAELLAPILGADSGDAFSLGLLHTLGAALLHQHEPGVVLCLPAPPDPDLLAGQEQDRYGITHQQMGARVLAAWHFPDHVATLIARHHEVLLPDAPALERTLHGARALTHQLLTDQLRADPLRADPLSTDALLADPLLADPRGAAPEADVAWITQGLVTPPDVEALLERVASRAQTLLEGLQPRR
jgi:HD-like signal output (HDOD) protein